MTLATWLTGLFAMLIWNASGWCEVEGCGASTETIIFLFSIPVTITIVSWVLTGRILISRSRSDPVAPVWQMAGAIIASTLLVWGPALVLAYVLMTSSVHGDNYGPSIVGAVLVVLVARVVHVSRAGQFKLRTSTIKALALFAAALIVPSVWFATQQILADRNFAQQREAKARYEPIPIVLDWGKGFEAYSAFRTGKLVNLTAGEFGNQLRRQPMWLAVQHNYPTARLFGSVAVDRKSALLRLTIDRSIFEVNYELRSRRNSVVRKWSDLVVSRRCKGPPLCGQVGPGDNGFDANDPRTKACFEAAQRPNTWCRN